MFYSSQAIFFINPLCAKSLGGDIKMYFQIVSFLQNGMNLQQVVEILPREKGYP